MSNDYLKSLVREHVENRDADYEFYFQKRLMDGNETREMPIEDYSVAWDEEKSIPVRVGRLRIPRQELDDVLDHEGEHMMFSPWNTTRLEAPGLAQPRPEGGVRHVVAETTRDERASEPVRMN